MNVLGPRQRHKWVSPIRLKEMRENNRLPIAVTVTNGIAPHMAPLLTSMEQEQVEIPPTDLLFTILH